MNEARPDKTSSRPSGRAYSFLTKTADPDIETIFGKVVARFVNFFVPFAFLALVVSSMRMMEYGFTLNYASHILIVFLFLLLMLLKRRISKRVLSLSLLAGIFFSGTVGFATVGLAGVSGGIALGGFCLFVGTIYGLRPGLAAVGLSLAVFALVGIGVYLGYVPVHMADAAEYLQSPITWAVNLTAFGVIVIAVILCISAIQEHLMEITKNAQAEHHFAGAVLDSQRNMVMVYDPETRKLIRWNSALNETTGYSDEEIASMTIPDAWTDAVKPTEITPLIDALSDGRRSSYEFEMRIKSGQAVPVEIRASRFQMEPEASELIILTARDLRDEKAAEQALRQRDETLRQSEKMQAVGELAGGIAHDFNNQLTAILGCADLLISDADKSRPSFKYLGQLKESAKRASKLTKQLLTFARRDAHESVPVDAHRIIGEVVAVLEQSIDKKIEISMRLRSRCPIVIGDPVALENALLNLGLNARDAMPEGGGLTIATEDTVRHIKADGAAVPPPPEKLVSISVADTGVGMDSETKRRMFEPFFTTKPVGKGIGMGLATVFGCVNAQRGDIDVVTELNKGTTVTLRLPAARDIPSELLKSDLPASSISQGSILVVDDEESVRHVMNDLLRDMGYEVRCCRDGTEALEYYSEHWADIDLVVLDMMMPHPDGKETFAALRRINDNIKVLIATGLNRDDTVETVLGQGAKAYLQKPFTANELRRKLSDVLDL